MEEMEQAVLSLDNQSLDQLLGYTVKWNTNSKHCEAAQSVLFIILTNNLPEDLLKLSGSRDWVEGLLPYTEKHFQRMTRLQMKSKFTTFLISNMKATSIPV
jgi:U3 small nucleolar RNA-associated protein 13